jgi:Rps23 Pro-64 3,4-dihydroxylase Tpa1-like proline 4-hydroxylase
MIFSYYEVKGLPVVIIDEYYSENAARLIWQELCFLNSAPDKFLNPEDTGSAWTTNKDGEKEYLRKNKAVPLDKVYSKREMSDILSANRKIFTKDMVEQLEKLHIYFRTLDGISGDATLINYYENSDYYLPHVDMACVTVLSWFFKQPKSFTGGQLIIEEELNIECVYNRTVIFPSMLKHSVESTAVEASLVGQNYGRYAVTQLISHKI